MVTASAPIMASVAAAFFDFGLRNAGTPLEMASTPVSAADPDENARSTRNIIARLLMVPVASSVNPALGASCVAPAAYFTKPVMIIAMIATTNAYTGTANALPDSRMPRRFSAVTTMMIAMENSTGCAPTTPIADPMLATPEAVDTATVRM